MNIQWNLAHFKNSTVKLRIISHELGWSLDTGTCLPEILISEYVLSWPVCTDKLSEPGVEARPPEPGGHTGQAHCSEWLTPLHHRGRLWVLPEKTFRKITMKSVYFPAIWIQNLHCWSQSEKTWGSNGVCAQGVSKHYIGSVSQLAATKILPAGQRVSRT